SERSVAELRDRRSVAEGDLRHVLLSTGHWSLLPDPAPRSAAPDPRRDGPILLRVHAHGRGAGALGDRRRQVRVLRVLLLVGGIDALLDRAVDGGEGDLGLDASCPDPSGVL